MPNIHYASADNLSSLHSTVEEEEEKPDNMECFEADNSGCSKVSEKAEEEEEERKKGDLETPTFSVGDIRRRLTEVEIPHKVPVRDPDDPSGVYACLHV